MKMLSSRIALGLLLIGAPAFAQERSTAVSRGSWIISGSAGFSRSHDDLSDQTSTSISASPTALMFVASRFAIGGRLTGGYSKSGSFKSTSYGLGPSARYYLGDSASKWLSFLGASVFPQWGTSKVSSVTNGVVTPVDVDATDLAMDASLGLTRLLVTHVGVTGEAYYTRINRSSTSRGTTNDFNTNAFGVRFGLTAFLY
jgi:hypothetical protein